MAKNRKKSSGGSAGGPPQTGPPRNEYWNQFNGFIPNLLASIYKEFERLAKSQGWNRKKNPDHYMKQKARAYEAEFNFHFTTGKTKLESWQSLCRELYIHPIPESIIQCKKTLRALRVRVNLVNLINRRRNPSVQLIHFASNAEFKAYTCKPQNTYPRELAKEEGYIESLLRVVSDA